MRAFQWTLTAALLGAGLAATLAVLPGTASAGDDDDVAPEVAEKALKESIAKGKELFESNSLGRKSCKECHEDPDKPKDDLRQRSFSYPSYSRRAKRVVTLSQKINEMIQYRSRGTKTLDAAGEDIANLAAYVESIKKR